MTKKKFMILSFLALAMSASAQIDKGGDGFGQRSTTQIQEDATLMDKVYLV